MNGTHECKLNLELYCSYVHIIMGLRLFKKLLDKVIPTCVVFVYTVLSYIVAKAYT